MPVFLGETWWIDSEETSTDSDRVDFNESDSSDTKLERPAKEGDVGEVP